MPSSVAALRERLGRARSALAERKGQQRRLLQEHAACEEQLAEAQEKAVRYEQVILLLQQTADQARRQAQEEIESLVRSSLQSVFGPAYSFRIELLEKAGRPEAEFYVVSPMGGEALETRPQDSRGGGVVDVVSLGLRIAMLQTYRPALEGALILDEPAKHVSDEYIQPVAQFVKTVSDVFGRQVIMVTHNPHLAEHAETAYQVLLHDGRSVATRT